jgi:tRNA1(Val) A37 N6-methylase TrmN6
MAAPDDLPVSTMAVTRDVFLGGRLTLAQPLKGYRAGVDAVLLAASVPLSGGGAGRVLDAGAGVGTVGLCVAARLSEAHVVLYERSADLAALCRANIEDNGFRDRATVVEGDIAISNDGLAALGLAPDSFDVVAANPPFHDRDAGTEAKNALKAGSHAMPAGDLEAWVRFMARMAKPGGIAAMIHKAEALARLLAAFEGRFGGVTVLPILARAGEPAIRVLVQGIKGSRAPLTLKPGFVLHGHGQAFSAGAEGILRHGDGLAL